MRAAQAIISRISCADIALRDPGRFSVTVAMASLISSFKVRYMYLSPCFYVKVLKKHFSVAVDILADILQNSLFRQEDIEKENPRRVRTAVGVRPRRRRVRR